MKYDLPIKELKERLSLAARFTADKDIVPALTYLYFKGATIRAYSGISGANIKTSWTFNEEFALRADSFLKIVSNLEAAGKQMLQFEIKEQKAILKCERSRYTLPILPPDSTGDFLFRDPSTADPIAIDLEFWAAVERINFSVGIDGSRPGLCGIFWSANGQFLSADGVRISIVHPKTPVKAPHPEGILLPSHLLDRLGAAKLEFNQVQVEGENVLWFHSPTASIWGQLIESPFPAERARTIATGIRQAIKEKQMTYVGFDAEVRQGLLRSLDLLLHFSENGAAQGRILNQALEMQSVQDSDVVSRVQGDGYESFDVKTDGPGGEFKVRGKMLNDIVAQVGTTRFWFSAQRPLYFLSDDRRFEHIIQLLARPEGHSSHANVPDVPEEDEGY